MQLPFCLNKKGLINLIPIYIMNIPNIKTDNFERQLDDAKESAYGFVAVMIDIKTGKEEKTALVVGATKEYITLKHPASNVDYNYKYETFTGLDWYLRGTNGFLRQQLRGFNEALRYFEGNAGQIIATKQSPEGVKELDGYHVAHLYSQA